MTVSTTNKLGQWVPGVGDDYPAGATLTRPLRTALKPDKRPPYVLTSEVTREGSKIPIWPPENGYVLYHAQVEKGVLWLVWQDVGQW